MSGHVERLRPGSLHPGLSHSGVDPIWEHLLLVATVVGAGSVLFILLTGHVSALLFGGGWPRYSGRQVPEVLWRFLMDPLDTAGAWAPVNEGGQVPGPLAWWSTCLALGAVAALPGAVVLRASREWRASGSRWAGWWDLRRLAAARHPGCGRLVVGMSYGRRVAVESRHSLLVFGPTQSGKTTGLAIPAILEWPGPVVATSTKGDLVQDTIGWRERLGHTYVFDPAGATSFRSSGWSPLADCGTWAGATRAAWQLAMAGQASVAGDMALADFWFTSASKSLAPYLFAAARTGKRIGDVARWIDREERNEVLRVLRMVHPDAAVAHEATFRREERARSSLFQVMQQILAAYLDPRVAATAERHEIVPAQLIDGGSHTLYITAPHHDQARFRPLFATLIGQILTAAYEQVAASGEPLAAPLLLVLDEAANIAPIDDLPTVASTAAAMGLQVVTVFQDLAQVRLRYGQAAGTIVNNHRAKLVLPGVSDLDTLDLASRLAGEEEISRDSVTTDVGGRRSTTRAAHWRRLLPPEHLRQLSNGRAVLLYGNLPPIRLRLRPWYRQRALRQRAALPAESACGEPPSNERGPVTQDGRPDTGSGPTGSSAGRPRAAPLGAVPDAVTVMEAARARLRLRPPIAPDGEG